MSFSEEPLGCLQDIKDKQTSVQVMSFICLACHADEDYVSKKKSLDQVPLSQFCWDMPVPEYGPQPLQAQSQHLSALEDALMIYLPKTLAKRLCSTAIVCCRAECKMDLDAVQETFSKVLDQAEALQAQIITDSWCVQLLCLQGQTTVHAPAIQHAHVSYKLSWLAGWHYAHFDIVPGNS